MRKGIQGFGIGGSGLGSRALALAAFVGMIFPAQTGLANGNPAQSPAQNLTIALRVYDYAGVAPAEYARAQEEASRVLRGAGLVTVWSDCPVPATKPQSNQTCRHTPGAPELVLRILPRLMAEGLGLEKGTLGFAQQSTDDAPAYVANVFYHRVEPLADELACSRAVILGHAVAHEIGHLLLGANRHSASGIMRAHWSEKELHCASAGSLTFLPQQAELLRAAVQARMELQETTLVSTVASPK